MIPHILFLQEARNLLINLLGENIKEDEIDETISQLKITLKSGIILYVRYNEFGEFGYQVLYSTRKNDFSRFDNFDDKWEVSTKPHHLHERGNRNVVSSSMIGKPSHDIPLLIKYIMKRKEKS